MDEARKENCNTYNQANECSKYQLLNQVTLKFDLSEKLLVILISCNTAIHCTLVTAYNLNEPLSTKMIQFQFSDHKNSLVCVQVLPSGIERKPETGELTSHGSILNCNSYDACKSRTDRFNDVCDEEYSRFTSDAISRVPEFTFNNMHGTVSHIGSSDAKVFRSKPNLSAIDKVKMNIGGAWTTKEVWESGGWEIGNTEYLTWQKYENRFVSLCFNTFTLSQAITSGNIVYFKFWIEAV